MTDKQSPLSPIEDIIEDARQGRPYILVDAEDRGRPSRGGDEPERQDAPLAVAARGSQLRLDRAEPGQRLAERVDRGEPPEALP